MQAKSIFRISLIMILLILVINAIMIYWGGANKKKPEKDSVSPPLQSASINEWQPPDSSGLPFDSQGELIRYGKNLVSQTSYYLGPKGKIATITNGMNCQNCHLDAGRKPWGNNYSAVFSTYPRFRERSGTVENIHKRINDCIERSLNGRKLDTNSREMQAIAAYINWVGSTVRKNEKPQGSGIRNLALLERAADPLKGKLVYVQHCQRCHGEDGEGKFCADSTSYEYPPLWGEHSYNIGAGLFRISRFAGYVKDNMPFGVSKSTAILTDEEAWDVAAYVNSQPRPQKKFNKDWPDIAGKPMDHPFGPYMDDFSEAQHKYGPFIPIQNRQEKLMAKKKL